MSALEEEVEQEIDASNHETRALQRVDGIQNGPASSGWRKEAKLIDEHCHDDYSGYREVSENHDDEALQELMKPLRQFLDDSGVTELVINRPGEVCVETSEGWARVGCNEMHLEQCLHLARAIATNTSQSIDERNPLLSATLRRSKERVQIVLPPAVEDGFVSFTFRKPSTKIYTLSDFEAQGLFKQKENPHEQKEVEDILSGPITIRNCGVKLWVDDPADVLEHRELLAPFEVRLLKLLWDGDIAGFLRNAVRCHRTMAVTGKTGSGKTTFMKGVMQECDLRERIITIEDAREIFLPKHVNKVHLLYSKGGQGVSSITPGNLLVSCLRMKPDRILLAEIREGECYDFLRTAASGHPGSITSLHAGTCMEAFEQMCLMIRQSEAGAGLSSEETQRLVRLSLDTIVQYKKDDRRRVSEIYYRPLLKQKTVGN